MLSPSLSWQTMVLWPCSAECDKPSSGRLAERKSLRTYSHDSESLAYCWVNLHGQRGGRKDALVDPKQAILRMSRRPSSINRNMWIWASVGMAPVLPVCLRSRWMRIWENCLYRFCFQQVLPLFALNQYCIAQVWYRIGACLLQASLVQDWTLLTHKGKTYHWRRWSLNPHFVMHMKRESWATFR